MRSYSFTVGTSAVNLRTLMLAADVAASKSHAAGSVNLTFTADPNNTGRIVVGGDASTDVNATAGSLQGQPILADQSYSVPNVNPSDVWMLASAAGQVVTVNASKPR